MSEKEDKSGEVEDKSGETIEQPKIADGKPATEGKSTGAGGDNNKDKNNKPQVQRGNDRNNRDRRPIGRGDRGRAGPYQQQGPQRSRPTLDVYSFNLIHLWNVSNSLNWGQLRKTLAEKFGKVKFIETFEAWAHKKIGHVILEFENKNALNGFVNAIENENFLEAGVQWDVNKNRAQFFRRIREETGVDLLACEGIPPTFKWKQLKGNVPSPLAQVDVGWAGGQRNQGTPNMGGGRYRQQNQADYSPYNQQFPSSDAQLRARPFSGAANTGYVPNPSFDQSMMTPGPSPFQGQQQQTPIPWHSTPQQMPAQQQYDSYGNMLYQQSPYNQRT